MSSIMLIYTCINIKIVKYKTRISEDSRFLEIEEYVCFLYLFLFLHAAKDMYDYTMNVDENWLLDGLNHHLRLDSTFSSFLDDYFFSMWNLNMKDKHRVRKVRRANTDYTRRCHDVENTTDSKIRLSNALYNEGRECYVDEKYELSLSYLTEALEIKEEIMKNDPTSYNKKYVGYTIDEIAKVKYKLNLKKEAVEDEIKALKIALEISQEEPTSSNYHFVAWCYRTLSEFFDNYLDIVTTMDKSMDMLIKSLAYYEKALEIEDTKYNRLKVAQICNELSITADKLGAKKDEALRKMYASRGLEMANRLLEDEVSVENYMLIDECYRMLIEVLLVSNDEVSLQEALIYSQKLKKIAQLLTHEANREHDWFLLQKSSFYIADILFEQKKYDEALKECLYNVDLMEKHPFVLIPNTRGIFNLMGDIYKVKEEYDQSEYWYNCFLKDNTFYPEMFAEMKILLEQIDTELIALLPHEERYRVKYASSRLFNSMIDVKLSLAEQYLLPDTENYLTYLYGHYFAVGNEIDELVYAVAESEYGVTDKEEYLRLYEEYKNFIIP